MLLVVCEKDDAARRISAILSNESVTQHKRGKVSIYTFRWKGSEACAIGLRGHIMNLDFPDVYRNWGATDPAVLIDAEPVKVVSEKAIASTLKSLAAESSEVYMATDFDREGELIGMEALVYAIGDDAIDRTWRVRFSSFTKEEINASFRNLVRIDRSLANSAEARQVIDLIWGASLTRFVSLASDRLGHEFLSVGRVQSPTLALIVDRERDIKSFVPRPYWNIEADVVKGIHFLASHTGHDIQDRALAEGIFARIGGTTRATIVDVVSKQRVDRPPAPFNTTTFIKAANNLGLSAARIMSIAEDLYTNGYISYPRTDNTVYPPTLDLRGAVEALARGPYTAAAMEILSKERIVPTKGEKEATDHPPIYPTQYAELGQLSQDQFKVYDLIVRRFLSTLLDPAKVSVTSVKIDIASEPFSASGIHVTYPGWRSVYPFSKVNEAPLPALTAGETVDVADIRLLAKETKPPRRYSQGGLIQEMERLGLGTKSTRHEIIQKLYDRRFIEESPPKPTLSGEALVNSLERHAATITKPEMTAALERDMEMIAAGEQSVGAVVEESRQMLREVMVTLKEHKGAIGKEISEALQEQNVVGKCPRCDNPMLLVRSKWGKRYVRCSKYPGCSKSYPLPQKGKVTFTDERCEKCRSPIIVLYRKRGPPYGVCINPKCTSTRREHASEDQDRPAGEGGD